MSTDTINGLVIGVAGSLIASIIIGLAVMLYNGARGHRGIQQLLRLRKDTAQAGIINVFPNRDAYRTHKDHGKAGEYVKKCKQELIYVGFWLAHGTEMESLIETVKEICLEKKKVKIVLLNPANKVLMKQMAEFLNMNRDEMVSRIENSINKFTDLQCELNKIGNNNLKVCVHNVPINYSAFMLDYADAKNTRILVDYKTYHQTRENSYGIEFKNRQCTVTKSHAEAMIKIIKKAKKHVRNE